MLILIDIYFTKGILLTNFAIQLMRLKTKKQIAIFHIESLYAENNVVLPSYEP